MAKGKNPPQLVRTVSKSDVGKPILGGFIGAIQKQDVGKRVYRVGGILQIENNEQRDRRLGIKKNPKYGKYRRRGR